MALIVGNLMARLGFEDGGFESGMRRAGSTASATSAQITAAENRIRGARAATNAAALRTRTAEEQLRALRATGIASSRAVAAAEARLMAARNAQAAATARAAQAANGLRLAQAAAVSQTNALAAAATRARGALSSIGMGMGIGAVVLGLAQAVQAARALGAQTNQMSVIFGDNAGQIKSWGETAVTSMRMSQREAQGAAIQFATFGKAMGLAGQDLVGFSTQQAKLAADLASFQGIPVADAIAAMGSAYAGETETMRQYGVLLDENTIKQAAYKNGVAAVGAQLTVQQKAQGAYYSMMEQLNHVNGDVERSNGKFGASMKTLTARFEETQAAVGSKLIPVIQPFVDLLTNVGLPAIQGLAGAVGAAAGAFNSLPGPVRAALAAVVAFRLAQRLLGSQMATVTGRFAGFSQQIANVQRAATITGGSLNRAQAAAIALGRGVVGSNATLMSMQAAFLRASSSATSFPRATGLASAAMTGMKGAATGLMGVLGGPWGMALAGATVALGFWMKKKQEDAAKSQAAEAATNSWADALRESEGAITNNVREMVAQDDRFKVTIESADKLGISQRSLSDAMLDQGSASKDMVAQLDEVIAAHSLMSEAGDRSTAGMIGGAMKMDDVGTAAQQMRDGILLANREMDTAKTKAMRLAETTGDVKVSFDGSKTAAGALSEAMTKYAESTEGAATNVDSLAKALKGLRDDNLTQEEALQGWSDGMRDLTEAFSENGRAALDAQGHFDVTSEKGSKLQDAVMDQADAWDKVASAEKVWADQQVAAGKMTNVQAIDHMNGKLAQMRQEFVDSAVAVGYNATEARKLSEIYFGMPGKIVTDFQMEGVKGALSDLEAIKIKGAKPIDGKYVMYDNTPEVRKRLDDIVKYSVIDGKVVINQDDVEKAKIALGDLGLQTETLPEGYIKITDNSLENMERLRQLGFQTKTLPDGTVVINADDAGFQDAVRRAQEPGSKTITVYAVDANGNDVRNNPMFGKGLGVLKQADGGIHTRANGGIDEYAAGGLRPSGVASMPSQAVIEKGSGQGLVRWAEGETGWEAYIPGKKNARTYAILGEAARRLGFGVYPVGAYAHAYADGAVAQREPYGLPAGSSGSGDIFPAWVHGIEQRFGVQASTYAGHQEGSGLNKGIDWGGPVDKMQGFAEYLAGIKGQMEQVIWMNPNTGQQIGVADGEMVGPGTDQPGYYRDDWANHTNHVHTRQSYSFGDDAAAGETGKQQVQDVELTKDSSREDVAKKIIAEGRKRGYTDDQIKGVLATAIQESNLDPDAVGGGGAWHGIFQQDESYPGRDDPNTQVTGFYDRLDEKKEADPNADIYDQIFWLQQRPGESSAADAVANGRSGYMDEIKSKDGEAGDLLAQLGPSVGTDGGTDPAASGVGSQVYVTGGHLDSIGNGYTPPADTTTSKPDTTTTPSTPDSSRKKMFTLGGGSIYNPNPTQPKSPSTGSGPTGSGTKAPKASTIQAAQDAADKAKRTHNEAVEKQRLAEMKLDEVRANPKAKASQITAAEQAVTRAKNDVTDATDKQRLAEMRLQELQAQGKPATQKGPTVKRLNGGTIPGTGRGDIVPMMGEPGEEVIRRGVATLPGVRAALQHLNRSGRWPEHHQDGGTVGGFSSGFGGYTQPTVAKVGLLDKSPAAMLEQLYRLGVAGFGGAAMIGSAIGTDGTFQGLSTGSNTIPILDDIAKKLDEVIKEGRVGSIGIYVGEGGQIVVEDMGKLRDTQDKAVNDAMMRHAVMR